MNSTNLTPVLISGVSCYEQDGTAYLKLEDVARGMGFTDSKNGVEYVRWARVDKYLAEFGFATSGERPEFIPENVFYRLAMKANNPVAEKFQALVADEIIPSIRKTGAYSVSPYKPKASSVGEVIKLVEVTRSMMEDQGCDPMEIAQAVKQICDQFNINLPDFFVRPKEMTIQDAMDMVDFIYSHERGRGKRKPTYQEFVEVQVTLKRLEGSAQ